jgi:hypothetical protein
MVLLGMFLTDQRPIYDVFEKACVVVELLRDLQGGPDRKCRSDQNPYLLPRGVGEMPHPYQDWDQYNPIENHGAREINRTVAVWRPEK